VIITPVNVREGALLEMGEQLYNAFLARGIEVLLDDRDERAGVKFNDADLLGIPVRVTIGPKRAREGNVEIKTRRTGDTVVVPLEKAVDYYLDLVPSLGNS